MVDIRDYISLSSKAHIICSPHTCAIDFKDFYDNIDVREKKSLIRHFVVNNIPFAFKDKPILYEQITQYIADKLKIAPAEVKLIGSAKTGFSITPHPTYGKKFGVHSDLDFSIINERLYSNLEKEFSAWAKLYKSKRIYPINKTEEKYWNQNLDCGQGQFRHGFLDTNFIPNRNPFNTTKSINNSLWLINKYLKENHCITTKKATARVYKNWHAFSERLFFNTEKIMRKV